MLYGRFQILLEDLGFLHFMIYSKNICPWTQPEKADQSLQMGLQSKLGTTDIKKGLGPANQNKGTERREP